MATNDPPNGFMEVTGEAVVAKQRPRRPVVTISRHRLRSISPPKRRFQNSDAVCGLDTLPSSLVPGEEKEVLAENQISDETDCAQKNEENADGIAETAQEVKEIQEEDDSLLSELNENCDESLFALSSKLEYDGLFFADEEFLIPETKMLTDEDDEDDDIFVRDLNDLSILKVEEPLNASLDESLNVSAGLYAALENDDSCENVNLLDKGYFSESGTVEHVMDTECDACEENLEDEENKTEVENAEQPFENCEASKSPIVDSEGVGEFNSSPVEEPKPVVETETPIPIPVSTSSKIAEARSFLNNIKQKSECRLKVLEEVPTLLSIEQVADSTRLKSELDVIQKLDTKLQELETMDSPTGTSRSEAVKSVPSALLYLRDERKRLRKQLLLKRTLEKLDPIAGKKCDKHVLRNIRLGPRARYFSLTDEEEALVEELLSRSDFFDEETSDGNSTTSSTSTAFDYEGEDAQRMAEIDEKLEQFIEIHSACGTPSLSSGSGFMTKTNSVYSQCSSETTPAPSVKSNSVEKTASETRSRSLGSISRVRSSLNNSVEDYLTERKETREHQAKVESIDRKLRELMAHDTPTLSREQIEILVSACMKEQSLDDSMRPFLCIKT